LRQKIAPEFSAYMPFAAISPATQYQQLQPVKWRLLRRCAPVYPLDIANTAVSGLSKYHSASFFVVAVADFNASPWGIDRYFFPFSGSVRSFLVQESRPKQL
jgi:hypothetical protein